MEFFIIAIIAIIAWVLMIGLGLYVAAEKGRAYGEGFWLPFLFGPFGVLILALLPSKAKSRPTPPPAVAPQQLQRDAIDRRARFEAQRLAGVAELERRRIDRDRRRAARRDWYLSRGVMPGPFAWLDLAFRSTIEWAKKLSDLAQALLAGVAVAVPGALLLVAMIRVRESWIAPKHGPVPTAVAVDVPRPPDVVVPASVSQPPVLAPDHVAVVTPDLPAPDHVALPDAALEIVGLPPKPARRQPAPQDGDREDANAFRLKVGDVGVLGGGIFQRGIIPVASNRAAYNLFVPAWQSKDFALIKGLEVTGQLVVFPEGTRVKVRAIGITFEMQEKFGLDREGVNVEILSGTLKGKTAWVLPDAVGRPGDRSAPEK